MRKDTMALRPTPEPRALIDRAARLLGRDGSDIIVEAS